jgi:hypothetical protein
LGQILSPFASIVWVAGVVISHSPHLSLSIGRVSGFELPLVQVLVSKPSFSQVAGVVSTQFPQVAQAMPPLLLTLDKDGSLLEETTSEDEETALSLDDELFGVELDEDISSELELCLTK